MNKDLTIIVVIIIISINYYQRNRIGSWALSYIGDWTLNWVLQFEGKGVTDCFWSFLFGFQTSTCTRRKLNRHYAGEWVEMGEM